MNIREAFPSSYLRASDLGEHTVTVTVTTCELEQLNNDKKPVLYFRGKEKGLVLNKTNAEIVATAYGEQTSEWSGREIELYTERVQFQGKLVDAIRVRIPEPTKADIHEIPF